MSALRDWQDILTKLESEKIKERSEGVARFRDFLTSKRNFAAVNRDKNHSWLVTLQTLFHVVITERNAHVGKKESAATRKRLDEATQLVRFAVEKVHRLVSRKTAKAIINHLTQMIAIQGKLQDAYALTYLKTLRSVLAYPPHLEHLDERQWTDIVMLCFSAVLGDKIKIGQDFADDVAMDIDTDSELDEPQPRGALRADSDDELPPPGPAASSARKRAGPTPARSKRTANPTEIELLSVIEVAFRAQHAPFLVYAQSIFRKFLRFLRLFPDETSAHPPALTALNRALAELDLNDQRSLRRLGPHLWGPVLALWPTKNAGLKEQVVVALRYLFPFVVPSKTMAAAPGASSEADGNARARELYEAVLSEPTIRWREAYELDVDHLRLGLALERDRDEAMAFHAQTFRIASGFDEKHAVAWQTLELGAAALARVYEVGEEVRDEDGLMSPTQRGKRRRIEDPLTVLLDSLTDPLLPTNAVAFRVQALLFLVERHWGNLSSEACRRILDALVPLLSHLDPGVERWAFLAIAAIAHSGLPDDEGDVDELTPGRRHRRDRSGATSWEQIWQVALRRLSVPEVCRAAAHTANVLLAHGRIPAVLLADSIETFGKELDVQAPTFPSDAVCLFLEWALAIASSDARLVRLNLQDKVLTWVTTAWKPLDGVYRAHTFGQARPHADPLSLEGLISLFARFSAISDVPKIAHDYFVPDCAAATLAIEMSETAEARDYIDAKLPPYVPDDTAPPSSRIRTPAYYDADAGTHEDLEHKTQRRLSGWLKVALEGFKRDAELSGSGETYWSGMASDIARRHLDFAALALVVEGLFALNKMPTVQHTVRLAAEVLTALAPTLALKKWQPAERALLLGGLSPILVSIPDRPAVDYPVLLDPGTASDIPDHLLPKRKQASHRVSLDSLEFQLLRAIWRDESTRTALDELLAALRFILSEVTETPTPPSTAAGGSGTGGSGGTFAFSQVPSTQASQRIRELEETQKKDDFGEVRDGSRSASVLGSASAAAAAAEGASNRAGAATIAACIKGFISVEMAASGSAARPVRLQEVVEAILNSASGDESVVIAEQAFAASLAGLVTFSVMQAESLLHHLGGDLLPDYRYARDERFARTALRFLECTREHWIAADGSAEELGADARTLCAWFINSLRRKIVASWRVRLQFTAFLDMYLVVDPGQGLWDVTGNAPKSEDGRLITPTAIIPFMLSDRDFRVRFRAASSAANLFNYCAHLNLSEQQLFDDVGRNVQVNTAESELAITHILCNANILIVAATRRRAPYHLLVKMASESLLFANIAIATLEGVAARLGFETLADLYLPYARYFLHLDKASGSTGPDLGQRLAYRACGFPTLRDARKADFPQTASFLVERTETIPAFRTMCDVLKRSEPEGRLACLPETISLTITRFHAECAANPGLPTPSTVLESRLLELAQGAGAVDQHLQDKLLDSVVDEIFAETMALTFDRACPAGTGHPALQHDKRADEAFASMVALPQDLYFDVEAAPPYWSAEHTVAACVWLDSQRDVFKNAAVVFSVVHNLLGKVHRAHFVAEQRRQLVNLALAVSLCYRGVQDFGILATLSDGLIRLLPHSSLVVLVPAMLQWTLKQWLALLRKSPSSRYQAALVEHLVRAAQAAQPLADQVRGGYLEPLIVNLQNSLLKTAQLMYEAGEASVTEAALYWPGHPFTFTSTEHVQRALSSPFRATGKFALASAIRRHGGYGTLLRSSDRGHAVWRLMQAISPDEELTAQDCFAFADLLYDVEGEADAPGVQQLEQSYIQTSDDSGFEGEQGVKQLVILRVLHHLDDPDAKLMGTAFHTAKLVFSALGGNPLSDRRSSTTAALAAYLASPELQRPLRLRLRMPRTLAELQTGDLAKRARDFPTWVKGLAELLADARAEGDEFYAQLVPLIQHSAEFAKAVTPYLVYSTLLQAYTTSEDGPNKLLSPFFCQVLQAPSSSLDAVRLIVEIAIYLRRHARPDLASVSRSDLWLNVPWVELADGAVKTGAYLAALLFLELAHENDGLFKQRSKASTSERRLDEQGQALLYAIYSEIDEPDGFYGRESPDVRETLLRRYRHEGQWDGAFRMYGARHEAQSRQLGAVDSAATAGVVTSLASFGFNRLAMSIYQPARLDGTMQAQDVSADLPYELAWRTDVWDLPIERQAARSSSVSLYSALRAARTSRSVEATRSSVALAVVDEVKKLSAVTLDLPRPNQEALSTILALREVDRLADLKENDRLPPELTASIAIVPAGLSFQQAERVLSSRISVLRGIRTREHVEQVGEAFASELYNDATTAERACLVELSRVARRSNQLQAAFNAVTLAHTLVEDGKGFDVDEELANVLWAQGEHTIAIKLLGEVLKQSPKKQPALFARLGEWSGEARIRTPQQIVEESFEPAVRAIDRSASAQERAHVHQSFAVFADKQLENLQKTLADRQERLDRYQQRKKIEFAEIDRQLQSGSFSSSKLERSKINAQQHLEEDERLVEEAAQAAKSTLWRAVENYAKALALSDDCDDEAYRLCALWFARPDSDELHGRLKPLLAEIPSRKFVPLAYQLSARLTKDLQPNPSVDNIRRLVLRLCAEHPFHSLYPVHGLCEGQQQQQKTTRRSSAKHEPASFSKTSRAQAAVDVLNRLKKNDALRRRVEDVELVLEAYHEWASYSVKAYEPWLSSRKSRSSAPPPIPPHMRIVTKLRDVAVPVTTFDLPIDPLGRYDPNSPNSFPTIKGYRTTFTTAGGVHLPKITLCVGSDEKEYRQLFKGGDDIRQDAVMQQVFGLVNNLLARDEEGRRRRLHLRTYKVVPLQGDNGMLEFVPNTDSLGNVLNRLYDSIQPKKISEIRQKLGGLEHQHRRQPDMRDSAKINAFTSLLDETPPLMRYLFWQKHKVPSLWFDMRLNYSRSVATTSIVGYVVGLGDRHVSNILMDESSGEVVHIDFGVAFESGKRLPIPELVPFRLTQNLIDGFGMSGVDGVFRRCSEETLRVLRERSNLIMTILEVFKYDPLQNWAVSADMAKRIQGSPNADDDVQLDELPDDADRALAIVRGKLDARLSVQYTVNQLIQEATDVKNLAVIFSGWQPIL
ncbi:hypothetical protein JCM10207_005857 [Rhodosporidiobolus poonsookiae]